MLFVVVVAAVYTPQEGFQYGLEITVYTYICVGVRVFVHVHECVS